MEQERKYRLLTLAETVERLCERKKTVILCHTRPDPDTFGSAIALKKLLLDMGIEARVACDTQRPRRIAFLPDEQESYLLEDVTKDFEAERYISVDTASPAQLGALEHLSGSVSLMIDHHERGEQYADGYIAPGISATGELILRIAEDLLDRGLVEKIGADIAICIYAAISSDTGCFKYSSVTPETHLAAAKLLGMGINAAEINHFLFDSKPFPQLLAEKLGFSRLQLFEDGKIAIISFPFELKEEHGIEEQYMETLVDVARSVEGVQIAAVIKQPTGEGVFRCSMRSSCEADVAKICAELGGGGHAKAAGCTVFAESIEKATETVYSHILAAFNKK